MSALDANADDAVQVPVAEQAPAAAVIGPLAGDPSILGLGTFIVGATALGLGLVGVVPAGVLGAPLALLLAATAVGEFLTAIWCAALGQSAVAAIFGIFGGFWLSYAVLVLALDHNWFVIPATAVIPVVKLFLLSWLIAIVLLTLCTLRLPSLFTLLFAVVDLALLLLYIAYAEASALGVPSSGLIKAGGYAVLLFTVIGMYLFAGAASVGTGGNPLPLGKPLLH